MAKKAIAFVLSIVMLSSILVGCSSGNTDADTTVNEPEPTVNEPDTTMDTEPDTEAASDAAAFPVTIQHAYGETVIETQPERVVTLFDSNADAVLALGVVPVGVSKIGYGVVDENGQTSWTAAAFEALGAEVNAFDDTAGIDFEAVSDAAPDVIICPNSGISQEEYDRLCEIAPTIPYTEMAYAITWAEQVAVTAKALGMEEEGQKLIEDTNTIIADTVAANPVLEGKTAAFCWIDPADLSVIYIYMPLDPRAGFLEELGLAFPEELDALSEEGAYAVTVSSENIDVLNCVDIIVCYGEESVIGELQSNPVINTVPAVANGAIVPISSTSELYMGTYATVLSVPYVLDEYVGLLADAAAEIQ